MQKYLTLNKKGGKNKVLKVVNKLRNVTKKDIERAELKARLCLNKVIVGRTLAEVKDEFNVQKLFEHTIGGSHYREGSAAVFKKINEDFKTEVFQRKFNIEKDVDGTKVTIEKLGIVATVTDKDAYLEQVYHSHFEGLDYMNVLIFPDGVADIEGLVIPIGVFDDEKKNSFFNKNKKNHQKYNTLFLVSNLKEEECILPEFQDAFKSFKELNETK